MSQYGPYGGQGQGYSQQYAQQPYPPQGYDQQAYAQGYGGQQQPYDYAQPQNYGQQQNHGQSYGGPPATNPAFSGQQQQPYNYQAPPPTYDQTQPHNGHKPSHQGGGAPPAAPPPRTSAGAQKWNPKPVFQDVWAAVLFVVNLAAFVVIAVMSLKEFSRVTVGSTQNWGSGGQQVLVDTRLMGGMVGMAGGVALVMTVLGFLAIFKFPRFMIIFSFWFNVVLTFAMGIVMFIRGSILGGVIWVILGVLFVVWWFMVRSRIPFATIMLETVCGIAKRFPATFFVTFLGIILQTGLALLYGATLISCNLAFTNGLWAVVVFLLFSWYWTSQVVSNVLHVSVCGLYATYYFFGVQDATGRITVPVRNPTGGAVKRAMTTSFGSICFGSLIVAIIQTIRVVVRSAMQQAADDRNLWATLLLCCLSCILQMLENMIEYFNKWAFAQVAIYGKGYIQAAKDTWALCKSRGIDAVINDSLIDNVLGMCSLITGLVCGFACYFFAQNTGMITVIPYDETTRIGFQFLFAVLGLFVGVSIFMVAGGVIDSGQIATFVCLAEDPAALARTKPDLFNAIRQRYPAAALVG